MSYVEKTQLVNYNKNIQFVDYWVPRSKFLETIYHSVISALSCAKKKPDLVHVHNIGPSLILPILKIFNIKTIVTYHSANYEHQKWGVAAKKILKLGEKLAITYADHIIFVSKTQEKKIRCRHKTYIPNGIQIPVPSKKDDYINALNLKPQNYILAVSRFAPEKGLLDLISAFQKADIKSYLVVCGDADHESDYSRQIKKAAYFDKRIILTGYITGEKLAQIYSHALLFVLPSHQEGHPIALLEALSYQLPVLVSDIPQNLEIGLPTSCYFKTGNHVDMIKKLEIFINDSSMRPTNNVKQNGLLEKYNWKEIADNTLEIYRIVASKKQARII